MAQGSFRTARVPPVHLPRGARVLLAASYAVVAGVVALDLATGPKSTFSPLLAALPVLSSVGTRRTLVPLLAGSLAVALAAVLAVTNTGVPVVVHATAVATVVAVTLTSTATVALIRTRERELVQVRDVAETAQRALLRSVPSRIGSLRIAVRYQAAAAEARIGGDLYEVLETPYGVRILLGDVRGKGLAAVQTAVDVLGVFREAARADPDLTAVAGRLDAALARRPPGEEFVTAVLVELDRAEGPALIVNCGHPPPLLLRDAAVTPLRPPGNAPPLALRDLTGEPYTARTFVFVPGDVLLLYTDGISEARDAAGRFYPLEQRLTGAPARDPEALLDRLLADVRAYVPGGMDDDAAVLAVRRER